MKIRIKGNFVRYRLTKSDVRRLADEGRVQESTCFGPEPEHTFFYVLETRRGLKQLDASFNGTTMTMYVPYDAARAWPDSERVGFENEVPVAPHAVLRLLLEKDFVCIDETVEDQSDHYTNPREVC
jgi:hypothetical protein